MVICSREAFHENRACGVRSLLLTIDTSFSFPEQRGNSDGIGSISQDALFDSEPVIKQELWGQDTLILELRAPAPNKIVGKEISGICRNSELGTARVFFIARMQTI
jgi:hypothetical protein